MQNVCKPSILIRFKNPDFRNYRLSAEDLDNLNKLNKRIKEKLERLYKADVFINKYYDGIHNDYPYNDIFLVFK
jgi:hypothetical protein